MAERSTYSSDSATGREGAHGARGLAEGVAEHIREVCEVLEAEGKSIARGLQLTERRCEDAGWYWGRFGNGDFFRRKEETDESGHKSERQNGWRTDQMRSGWSFHPVSYLVYLSRP